MIDRSECEVQSAKQQHILWNTNSNRKAISINTEAAGTDGDVKQTHRDTEHTAGMDQPWKSSQLKFCFNTKYIFTLCVCLFAFSLSPSLLCIYLQLIIDQKIIWFAASCKWSSEECDLYNY